jgi:hypothetical protein
MAAMTVEELVDEGYSRAEAELIMAKRVFGDDVKFDKHGKPIETGRGSAWSLANRPELNVNHYAAIEKYEGKDAADAARAADAKRAR